MRVTMMPTQTAATRRVTSEQATTLPFVMCEMRLYIMWIWMCHCSGFNKVSMALQGHALSRCHSRFAI